MHLRTLRLFRGKAHADLLNIAMCLQDQLDEYGIKLPAHKMMLMKCIKVGDLRGNQEAA